MSAAQPSAPGLHSRPHAASDQSGVWPKAGAAAAVFHEGCVLLGERGKGPPGVWSLPGGHIEPGETAASAAAREIAEETGITAEILGLIDTLDIIHYDRSGALAVHYLLAVFYGLAHPGVPVAASDCRQARFVPLDQLDAYALTADARRIIAEAARRLEQR